MRRLILAFGAIAAGVATTVLAAAQQPSWVLRDFAMPDGHFYIRAPRFVAAPDATFLADGDRVIGVTGDGVTKAYPARVVTWHHGVEDRIGKLPVFVTW
jgi:hypothetical protein